MIIFNGIEYTYDEFEKAMEKSARIPYGDIRWPYDPKYDEEHNAMKTLSELLKGEYK